MYVLDWTSLMILVMTKLENVATPLLNLKIIQIYLNWYIKKNQWDKAWKRRGKTILSPQKFPKKKQGTRIFITPTKTKLTLRCPKSTSSAVDAMQILLKYHTARLDNVLKSNGLMRHPIYPDGNCFINAILYYLKEEGCEVDTVDSLRSKIADHFMQNMNYQLP
jgi:hypothetical protein